MWKILRTVLDELRVTFRGIVLFYLDLAALLVPDSSPRRTTLTHARNITLATIAAGIIGFAFYGFPSLEGDARQTAIIAGIVIAAVLAILAAWMIATVRPRLYAVQEILKAVVLVGAMVVAIGHPVFPGWGKLVASGVLLVGVVMVARRYLKQSDASKVEERPMIRGRILALLPFYMTAVVCLLWGFNQALPEYDEDAWFVEMWRGHPDRSGGGGDQSGGAIDVDDPARTTYIDGWSFWGHGIQRTTGIATAPLFEKVYWYIAHPVATFFGADLGPRERFNVGRLQSWHVSMEILENVLGILTTLFFLGVVADIASTVTRRIQTGQADLDLSRDHGVALLTAVHSLNSRAEADVVRGSWGMMQQISGRAIDGLIRHIHAPTPQVRASAAYALRELGAVRAVPELRRRHGDEKYVRARSAQLDAMARLTPLDSMGQLEQALRGKDVVVAHTALAALTDIMEGNSELGIPALTREMPAPPPRENETSEQRLQREERAGRQQTLTHVLRDTLLHALDAPDDGIRDGVVHLLARLEPAPTGEVIAAELEEDEREARWREGALLALGELQWTAAEPRLARHARSGEEQLRLAALTAIGWHAGDDTLEILREACEDDAAEIRRRAFDSLGRRGTADDLDRLLAGLKDDDDNCRVAAAVALRRVVARLLADGADVPLTVNQALMAIANNRHDSTLRDQACFALAELGATDAVDLLMRLLPDPEAAQAIGMLGRSGRLDDATRQRAVQELYRASFHPTHLEAPSQSRERNAVLIALGGFGTEATGVLRDMYTRRPEDRRVVADALAETATGADDDPAVLFLVSQFDPRDRISAAWLAPALGTTGHPKAREALRTALYTSAAPIAARALGELRDREALPELMALANSQDAATRDAVFGALRKFSSDPATSAEVMGVVQRQMRVMGMRAASLLGTVFRAAGSFLLFSGESRTARPAHDDRPDPDDLLAEFG